MGEVKRVAPESRTGLINWIEQNFHNIEQYVAVFAMRDGTTMMTYDTYTYRDAVGLAGIATDSIHSLAHEDEFIPKRRD